MKFTLTRSTALTVLKQALKTCNTKAKGTADSEFLFEPIDGILYVTALNDTTEQNLILPCEGLDWYPEEAFSVAGAALVEFLTQFPEEEVKCVYIDADSQFVIGSKKTKFAFPTGVASDFVPFNYQAHGKSIEVNATALKNAFKTTAFAASNDHTQTPLTAVHLKISGDRLMAEGCDTLRMSEFGTEIEDLGADSIELLLPRETAETLASLFEDVAVVTIRPGMRHVRFEWGDTTFTSVLENAIGKPYPDLSRWMKSKEIGKVKLSKGDLLRSLKLAGLLAKDSYVVVSIVEQESDGTGGGLQIATNERDRGMSQDTQIVQEQSGEGEVKVAHKYLIKAVESTIEPWIELSFRELRDDAVALVVVDGGFEHLIFPVAPNETEETVADEDGSEEDED